MLQSEALVEALVHRGLEGVLIELLKTVIWIVTISMEGKTFTSIQVAQSVVSSQ